jgi:chromosome partitioning protein
MIATRIDYQDAIAAGLGVAEYAEGGRAACEIRALWSWIESRLGPSERLISTQVSGFKNRLAAIARCFS